jgi:hypothetical protein
MTNDYPTISQADFIRTRASLTQARNAALAAYATSIASKWDIDGSKPLEYDGEKIRATILTDTVVTVAEASEFEKDMHKRFATANESWRANQKERCDSFIRRYLSSMANVPGALEEYMTEFRPNNAKNPSIESVDRAMISTLEQRLEWLVAEYYREFRSENAVWDVESNRSARMEKAKTEFGELLSLCLAIKNKLLEGTPIQKSWAYKFATLCIEKGGKTLDINSAFQQRFEVTKILVKVDFESTDSTFKGLSLGAEIKSRFWQAGAKDSMFETLVNINTREWTVTRGEGGKWYSLCEGPRTFIINPWTDSYFTIFWEDRVEWGNNVKGTFSRNIWSEFRSTKEYKDGYLEYTGRFHGEHDGPDTDGTITVRLYGKFTGVDLSMLLQQSQQ